MSKKYIFLIIVLLVLETILVYYVSKLNRERNEVFIKSDTTFIDRPMYDSLVNKVDTVYKHIKHIEYEKDKRLERIDSISNDSSVLLFLQLLSE